LKPENNRKIPINIQLNTNKINKEELDYIVPAKISSLRLITLEALLTPPLVR